MIESTPPGTAVAWHDETLPAADRAAALLSAMTLGEKVQQLGSSWPGAADAGGEVAPMQDTFSRAEAFDTAIENGIGHLTRPFGTAPVTAREGMQRLSELQRAVMSANRFGVPAIAHEECLTGFTAWTATVYPTALAWGAAFNPGLVREMAAAIGTDMSAVGIHQGLAPVLDVVRDYRWGRVEETIGEDPVLVAEIAAAYVDGLQSAGVVATLKHFAGYSASRGARNHAPAALGSRELADVILPPFERAVAAGARSVMNSYAEVDGVPPASDQWLLTELLRNQWGFTGTVVSDYWAIPFLHSMHGVVASDHGAGVSALEAGLDVELPHTVSFSRELIESVTNGELEEAFVDRAALRILTQKAELGLLEAGWGPKRPEDVDLDSLTNRDLARRLAEESVVLLANHTGVLPIEDAPKTIAVIGPVADDPGCLFGCYSFPNHVVPNHPGTSIGVEAPSILEAIRAEFPASTIVFVKGVDISDGTTDEVEVAVRAVRDADLTILLVGDRSGMFGAGTSGEGCDVVTLRLPGRQHELAEAVIAAGERVVLTVVSGRPYAIGALADGAAATVQVFFPGEEGAGAIAGVLSGRVNPSGRLPVQIPGLLAPQPGTYLSPKLALKSDGVSNVDPTPAFPFGFGESYTSFELSELHVSDRELTTRGQTIVTATVTNIGARSGAHVAQLYVSDPVATVTRPVRRLLAFSKVQLEPGERAAVEFRVPAAAVGFTDRSLRYRVEPGEITFAVASSVADRGLQASVEITGVVDYPAAGERRYARSDVFVGSDAGPA